LKLDFTVFALVNVHGLEFTANNDHSVLAVVDAKENLLIYIMFLLVELDGLTDKVLDDPLIALSHLLGRGNRFLGTCCSCLGSSRFCCRFWGRCLLLLLFWGG